MKKLPGTMIAPGTMSYRLVCAVSLGLALLIFASTAHAGLHIRPVFVGGQPPADEDDIAGGGDLGEIVQVAAEAWERAFPIGGRSWNLTLEFEWKSLSAGRWAQVRQETLGGNNPVRLQSARIEFNNTPGTP